MIFSAENDPLDAVIILCGVGGVGKTSIANILKEEGANVFPSVTRSVHHEFGLRREEDAAALSPESFDKLQARIRAAYIERGHQFLRDNTEGVQVFERSIFDYTAYRAARLPFQTKEDYLLMMQAAMEFFDDPCIKNRKVYVFHLPFPVDWDTTDEFRLNPFTKNLQWEVMLTLHLKLFPSLICGEEVLLVHKLPTYMQPRERTRKLLDLVHSPLLYSESKLETR